MDILFLLEIFVFFFFMEGELFGDCWELNFLVLLVFVVVWGILRVGVWRLCVVVVVVGFFIGNIEVMVELLVMIEKFVGEGKDIGNILYVFVYLLL